MGKRRIKRTLGQWGGLREHRHGVDKAVTLAPVSIQQDRLIKGSRRKSVAGAVMDRLRDWRLSAFEHEGSTISSLRSGLCLQGHGWLRANAEATRFVAEALAKLGAQRPSWEQGQAEYTVPRETCSWCGSPVREEYLFGPHAIGFCSDLCARTAVERRDYETKRREGSLWRAATDTIERGQHEPRECAQCRRRFRPREADHQFCTPACAHASLVTLPLRGCARCGEQYRPLRENQRYCSRSCSAAETRLHADRACDHCARMFRPTSADARFCSRACMGLAKRTLELRRCVACNEEFRPRSGRQRYCSRGCADRSRPVVVFAGTCECCGTTFEATSPTARFCSTKCVQLVSRFKTGNNAPKRVSPLVLDYLLCGQGLVITDERMAA